MRILCVMVYVLALARSQRKGFLNPQSECRIHCLNGGFCAYLVDNPTVHTCLCLLDMFTGDRCQYQVVHTTSGLPSTTVATSIATHAPPYYPDDNEDYNEPQTTEMDTEEQPHETEEEGDDDYTEGWDSLEEYGNEGNPTRHEENEDENKIEEQHHSNDNEMIGHMESSDSQVHEESRDSAERRRSSDGTLNDVADDDGAFYDSLVPTKAPSFDIESGRYSSMEDDIRGNDQMGFPPPSNSKSAERQPDTSTERGLIPETEAEDDGWMMSKRRRVVSKGAMAFALASSHAALLLIGAFAFLRWTLPPLYIF